MEIPEFTTTPGGHWRIPKSLFKVSLEESRKIKEALKGVRQKAIDGGEEDEFDL